MIDKKHLDMNNLFEYFLFANTPAFIFKKYRSNSSVIKLPARYSFDELVDSFNNIVKRKNLDSEDYVLLYSILIGVTFFSFPDAVNALSKLDLSPLRWGNELKNLFISSYVPTSRTTIKNVINSAGSDSVIRADSSSSIIQVER